MIEKYKIDELNVQVYENRALMGEAAAKATSERIRQLLKEKETINIIFAAAPSQNEFLENLTNEKEIDWNRIRAFHMDEYVGLDLDAPQRFGNFLKDRIFGKLPFKSVFYLDGNAADLDEECSRYAELLKKYPAEIVCMGIGENAHIAFNDPHVADFNDPYLVKVVDLDPECRNQQVNDGCFKSIEEVPSKALTLTIPALMNAQYAFCMVPGKTKAKAVANTLNEKISEMYPSTILRRHPRAVLFLDKDSAAHIDMD
ncbi:MAG: glucosamine-6-phosphate deaminase [Bacteroidota bacterium]|nr:glucosamine-6-phosphate deaminase [Odoribacter sp.]MDP3644390.1 glucosamine-6-phosphate deaminase [Bacteroidota bacterium]